MAGKPFRSLPAPELAGLDLKADVMEGNERVLTYKRSKRAGPDFIVYLLPVNPGASRDPDAGYTIDYATFAACCCEAGNGYACGTGEGDVEYVGPAIHEAVTAYEDHVNGGA